MRNPWASARSCSSRSWVSSASDSSCGKRCRSALVGVDPNVARVGSSTGKVSREAANASRCPGDRCTREVQRAALAVSHHLDHVRVEELGGIGDRVRRGRDLAVRVLIQCSGHRVDDLRGSSGSSPCTLTTICSAASPSIATASANRSCHLMCGRRQDGVDPVCAARRNDFGIVGGNDYPLCTAGQGALRHTHDHRRPPISARACVAGVLTPAAPGR